MRKSILKNICVVLGISFTLSCQVSQAQKEEITPKQISGIYPHLAFYNNEGSECGVGALVPWANRLWAVSYGASNPYGSTDKLYEITSDLELIVRKESIGGTHANRFVHTESDQLFIGYHVIDSERNVRTIPYQKMPGRFTGVARHLITPDEKVYYGAMEGGFYEVNVNSLKVEMLYRDASLGYDHAPYSIKALKDSLSHLPNGWDELLGAHGKGLYSGQGVLVYSNNGETGQKALTDFDIESGALYEWDGTEWTLVRRNQFVEVTGPGGIYGNENPESDPIWVTGWDHKSVILGVRNPETGWDFYRLPKASHSYDGAHGWNTEWPRIRDIGTEAEPDYLMTMHGMFWDFPGTFTADHSAGVRPRSAYLKVIGDFTRWENRLVFGCDDSAHREFLNKRKAKGNIEGPGQSNSNLWFTSLDAPDHFGPATAEGGVWLDEQLAAGDFSEPFLFAGWDSRSVWIANDGEQDVFFTFEVDKNGDGDWTHLTDVPVPSLSEREYVFTGDQTGEWVRVRVDQPTKATVHFTYNDRDQRPNAPDGIFQGLSDIADNRSYGGLLYGLGDDRRALGILAGEWKGNEFSESGYYELDDQMNLIKKEDTATSRFIREKFAIPADVVTIDDASALVVDDGGRRWRLPLGASDFTELTEHQTLRICREVATERDLFSLHGTFYELPAENADGYAKIRPIASHDFRIHDYASYRGLLVMTGISESPSNQEHVYMSEDGRARVWAGTIDDLWKLGKPTGHGGPWKNSSVSADVPSDPYLIGFYDQRRLELTNHSDHEVQYTIQVEPVGHGPWMNYRKVTLAGGETYEYEFPSSFQARWIRFVANNDCEATAWLEYN